ncbi:phosphatase PAP2 family protein [Rariglobus hedericola]|uniref:Phosphatase PAP2 family protein n=1 Tax=Rariglobus hedericola TaxID=2597822 RepID=A0A556QGN5_9BACT|nr:phosphatase PAP2 family protein [Rariglobus hedericola]TSJ75803.1 phosphatase PAP2 family protein [Rariglobus hedericola]
MISRWKTYWKNAGWNEFVLFASVAALCLGVWLFIHVASVVRHETHLETETRFMRMLRSPENPGVPAGPLWLVEVGRDVSAVGGAVVVITLSLLVIGYLAMRRQWGRVALIAGTVAGGYVLSNVLKMSFDRARPDIVPHLSQVHSASFPSGHSMLSSLVYLTLGALLAQASDRRREKIYFVSVAFFLTFMIGLSRVFLGVHYPTDVLAGWSAGTAWAVACWLVAARFTPKPV